ncbi:OLC1v1024518C1 [Oldenlandia corymbosa var. corymbosa]|uniref:OLC1v1024518C1 n=1 Tax=Oldenlandia corymbosa var. corymbosa TaxID=529605 RepID=A0AAV1C2I6_OLDCO|nr:OLC1v1024518C1 [Oldenlandia corymbosa var. corymbosa]
MPPARRKVAACKNASNTRRQISSSSSSSSPERQRMPTPPPSPAREPTPLPPPQPRRAFQEQALNAITDEWEPRLFPRKKGWDFFLKHIQRKIITERGIGEDGATFAYIKHHGWETFSNPLVKPRITEAIRAIWKLQRVSTDYRETLAALHPNQPLEQAVLSRLAKEGTSWEMDDQENPLGFPANALQTPDLNLWHHFICCNLMPTSYTAKVTYEMALLLYAIFTDTPFDAASVIRDQLTRCITDPRVKSWYFPIMITMLCKRAGVTFLHIDAESSLQQPLRMHKLDQKPPGASSSGQATSTPTLAGQLRQRDFNKQTGFILDYVHQCQMRTEKFLQEMHKCIGCPENCPMPHDPPVHPLHGMPQ